MKNFKVLMIGFETAMKRNENYIPMKAIYIFCVFLCINSFSTVAPSFITRREEVK